MQTFSKNETDKMIVLINEVQRFSVHMQTSSTTNDSVDMAGLNYDDDQPDPLGLLEILIIISVLLLWFGSVLAFIRHSELLRIRHRDLPYRSPTKSPMNLNRVTVVDRTSDMVIHSKPRQTSPIDIRSTIYSERMSRHKTNETSSFLNQHASSGEYRPYSYNSDVSVTGNSCHDESLLNPCMVSADIRRSLLDLHRKSMDNTVAVKCNLSYSTNDVPSNKPDDNENIVKDERVVKESPV